MTLKSIVPAFFNGARRAAAGPALDAEPQKTDSFAGIVAAVLAVLVVAVIAVLLGMT